MKGLTAALSLLLAVQIDAFTLLSRRPWILALRTKVAEEPPLATVVDADVEEATKKWGLEGGLFKSVQKGNMDQAKELLKKYGFAYLLTSISFAAVSFGLCYRLIDSGVDVANLLAKVGISVDTTSETAGTATIAYIVHKAASPIRTVPVVALTPVVAEMMGKKVEEEA